ncbi:hypothetical protein SUDANB95_02688 [Actinosynnema sp. ALI-1.44]
MPTVAEVYGEDAAAVSAIEFPTACGVELPAGELAGTTVQWIASAPDEDRRVVVTGLIAALGGDVGADAVAGFLDAVGSEEWWLGEVCLRVGHPDGVVVLFPGSDGAFLHLVYPVGAEVVRRGLDAALAPYLGG